MQVGSTANLRSKILDLGGFYSRGGRLMSIGNLLEILSQLILAGRCLVIWEIGRS